MTTATTNLWGQAVKPITPTKIDTTNPLFNYNATQIDTTNPLLNYNATQIDTTNPLFNYNATHVNALDPNSRYTAQTWDPDANSLVENRISGLLNQDNPYMKAARASGLANAQSRGLLNSSMSSEAAQAAAIKAAFPIASQDAKTYAEAGMTNRDATNSANEFNANTFSTRDLANAGFSNDAARANALMQGNLAIANAGYTNDASRTNATNQTNLATTNAGYANDASRTNATNQTNMATSNAGYANDAANANLNASVTLSEGADNRAADVALQDDRQAFDAGENALDRTFDSGQTDKELETRKAIADAGNTTQLTIAEGIRNSEGRRLAWEIMGTALAREDNLTTDQRVTSRQNTQDFLTEIKNIWDDPDLTQEQKQTAYDWAQSTYVLKEANNGITVILTEEEDGTTTIAATPDGPIQTPAGDALRQNTPGLIATLGGAPSQDIVDEVKVTAAAFYASGGTDKGPLIAVLEKAGGTNAQKAALFSQATGMPVAEALQQIDNHYRIPG
jgi:hypothetical protein